MSDLEKECEDAVFEVCDARERFPVKCAEELERCIKLRTEINTMKVSVKPVPDLHVPSLTEEQVKFLTVKREKRELERFDRKLESFRSKLDNLKSSMAQIKREKHCEMNKLLRG